MGIVLRRFFEDGKCKDKQQCDGGGIFKEGRQQCSV